jgi:uncharacterized protein (DUF1697 family)
VIEVPTERRSLLRYVTLLGTVTVAGNRLKMDDIRKAFEAEELSNIETVVASDNILFEHPERPDEGLEEMLGLMMRDRFAMKSPVLVRSRAALAAAVAENPFAAEGDERVVHTLFLDGPVPAEDFSQFLAEHRGAERIAMGDRALHIDYVANAAEGKLVATFVERRLGRRGTVRSLRSLKRILAKMDES